MSRKLSKKKQQGKTKTTYGKGEQSELTITPINPFNNANELDFPYLRGKSYVAPEASEVRASRPSQPDIELDKVNRITTRIRNTKKAIKKANANADRFTIQDVEKAIEKTGGFNKGGMADYIKDLL